MKSKDFSMKKMPLITSLAFVALSTSAFAARDSSFYLRTDCGIGHFNNSTMEKTKLKSKYNTDISAGIGYRVMDNIRAEIAYSHFFKPTRAGSSKSPDGMALSIKTKANLQTLMLKGYYDIAELGSTKIFIEGGIGGSRIKQEDIFNGTSKTEKAKNNFSWLVGVGAGFQMTESTTLDFQYNYQDFGKSSAKSKSYFKIQKSPYRSHALKAGIRIDM